MTEAEQKPEREGKSPGLVQIAFSVLAAAFGVQSEENRERDFKQSSPLPYILVGIVFTILFVLTIIGVVMLVTA